MTTTGTSEKTDVTDVSSPHDNPTWGGHICMSQYQQFTCSHFWFFGLNPVLPACTGLWKYQNLVSPAPTQIQTTPRNSLALGTKAEPVVTTWKMCSNPKPSWTAENSGQLIALLAGGASSSPLKILVLSHSKFHSHFKQLPGKRF